MESEELELRQPWPRGAVKELLGSLFIDVFSEFSLWGFCFFFFSFSDSLLYP